MDKDAKIMALRLALDRLKTAAENAVYYRKQGTDDRFYISMTTLETRADEAQTVLEETEQ